MYKCVYVGERDETEKQRKRENEKCMEIVGVNKYTAYKAFLRKCKCYLYVRLLSTS